MRAAILMFFLFFVESYSMAPVFNQIIADHAGNKSRLFSELGEIRGSDADRDFAREYIELYGDNGLVGEDRKRVFRAIVPQKKQVITGAAAYVVKTLFGMAKHEVFGTSTLDECVRVATLLLTDVPQMYDVQRVLQVAGDMQKRREKFASEIASVCKGQFPSSDLFLGK